MNRRVFLGCLGGIAASFVTEEKPTVTTKIIGLAPGDTVGVFDEATGEAFFIGFSEEDNMLIDVPENTSIMVRVRNPGILPFEQAGIVTNKEQTVIAVIRTEDRVFPLALEPRSLVHVDWKSSPRVMHAKGSHDLTHLHGAIRIAEATLLGIQYPSLVSTVGGEYLGGEVKMGITMLGNNAVLNISGEKIRGGNFVRAR